MAAHLSRTYHQILDELDAVQTETAAKNYFVAIRANLLSDQEQRLLLNAFIVRGHHIRTV